MKSLHITSGDISGEMIRNASIGGEVFIWYDILYEGTRKVGWPDEDTLKNRANMISEHTLGELKVDMLLQGFKKRYAFLKSIGEFESTTLWFDACLFDQSMLVHLLTCLASVGNTGLHLIVIDSHPEIPEYDGLGQLTPEQLQPYFDTRKPVTRDQFEYAARVDRAFALQDEKQFRQLAAEKDTPLPWVPAAISRWLEEIPDTETGLGRLERMTLQSIKEGNQSPKEVFLATKIKESRPQYWGDISLWQKINRLADLDLIRISGPTSKLPQWPIDIDWNAYKITPVGDP